MNRSFLKYPLFLFLFLLVSSFVGQNNFKVGDTLNEAIEVYDTLGHKVSFKIPAHGYLLVYRYRWSDYEGKKPDNADSIKLLEAKISEVLLGGMVANLKLLVLSYDKDQQYNKWAETIRRQKPFKQSTKYKTAYYNLNTSKDEAKVRQLFTKLSLIGPDGRILRFSSSIAKFNYYVKDDNITLKAKLLSDNDGVKKPLNDVLVHVDSRQNDTLAKTRTDIYGDFELKIPNNESDYVIRAEPKENAKTILLVTQEGMEISKFQKKPNGFEYRLLKADILELSDLKMDEDISLSYKKFKNSDNSQLLIAENIVYDLKQFTIDKTSEETLNKVVTILKDNPKTQLEVISHTDSQGDDASNQSLSEKRARAVVDYLVANGISVSRLKPIGKGESQIRNRCGNGVPCSDKEHAYNRRTEFRFIR
ncbi:MAG: OmpA family protein [Bacteroidia bacterium]